jgi:hypothetical protein
MCEEEVSPGFVGVLGEEEEGCWDSGWCWIGEGSVCGTGWRWLREGIAMIWVEVVGEECRWARGSSGASVRWDRAD